MREIPNSPNEAQADGLGWGLHIHRYYQPKDWPAQLEKVPPEKRGAAEQYLRDIAARMKVIRRLKQQREEI